MAAFLDICRYNPTTGGTTDWTYSSAVIGYQSPAAAGAVNGTIYRYRAESSDLTQWEIGYGAYATGTGILARTTVLFNSLGTTAKINFSATPQVAIVALKEDLISITEANAFTGTERAQARTNITAPLKGHLYGLGLSTGGSSTTYAIAAGECADSTGVDLLTVATQYNKTTSAWAVGHGNGALDVGTIAASTWYHSYVIKRIDTGVVDFLASLSSSYIAGGTSAGVTMSITSPGVVTTSVVHGMQVNAPILFATTGALPTGLVAGTTYYVKTVTDVNNFTVSATQGGAAINFTVGQSGAHSAASVPTLPANYTLSRRIGALRTNASSQWVSFIQDDDLFQYNTDQGDLSATNPGTAAVTRTLPSAPVGLRVEAILDVGGVSTALADNPAIILISDLSVSDQAPLTAGPGDIANYGGVASGNLQMGGKVRVMTNVSQQVRSRVAVSGASTVLTIYFHGWIDKRGQGRDA